MNTYAHVIEALGDATRRAVLERLQAGPRSVGEIAEGLPVSRPAVSQHLRVLRDAGLVTDRQAGTRRIYQLAPEGLADLRRYIDGFWAEALAGLKRSAEREQRRDRS